MLALPRPLMATPSPLQDHALVLVVADPLLTGPKQRSSQGWSLLLSGTRSARLGVALPCVGLDEPVMNPQATVRLSHHHRLSSLACRRFLRIVRSKEPDLSSSGHARSCPSLSNGGHHAPVRGLDF